MSTYRELVYMCLDEVKIHSDDASFTEDHIIFLLDNYRSFLLKLKYSDIKKTIPESNYQTICLDLIKVPSISGERCVGNYYLRSKLKIPYIMKIGTTTVYPTDYFQCHITYISRERMKYVGYNKYLNNIIYASLGPDNYLYFKSNNPQHYYLEKVNVTGIFENTKDIFNLQCTGEDIQKCDILDMLFPIEESLIAPVIELVVKELLGAEYRPKDINNDANDDLSDLATFIKRNTKSNLLKQLEGGN